MTCRCDTLLSKEGTVNGGARADDITDSIAKSKREREQDARITQLERQLLLAKAQMEERVDALVEADEWENPPNLEAVKKRERGESRWEHKSKERKDIAAEWKKIEYRSCELIEQKKALDDERQKIEKMKWEFATQAKSGSQRTRRIASREATVVSDHEAPYGDAVLSPSDQTIIFQKPVPKDVQMLNSGRAKCEDYYEGSKTSLASPTSSFDTATKANSTLVNLARGVVRQEDSVRGSGIEKRPDIQNGPRVSEQPKMARLGKTDNSDMICGACRQIATHSLSPNFTTQSFCIMLLTIGIVMLIATSLCVQKTRKEQSLWLEANGLTRAHLLAIAPAGDAR
ncbi:hypothetical protein IF1G_07956 [Cordyceps javanica]|uniref:Uncharacterized protein n=1 Tax=Cordyceps javanica TaxID=43265 RepID=A0A545UV87_9HYPO|nr:hypothetical protein IF1G_07956 [Cordyceps javanica]